MYKSSAILYTFAYMAIGSFTPLIAQYLTDLGFDGDEVGIITAAGTAVAIFAVAIWGRVYSMASRKALVIELLCGCAILISLILPAFRAFVPIVCIYGLLYFFQSPIMSLIDSFTVLGGESATGFGGKRAWGAVGFALGIFVAGRAADMAGTGIIFALYASCFAVALITLAYARRKRSDHGVDSTVRNRATGYLSLLKERKVVYLLICMFFMGGTNVANNTYFSFLYIDSGGTLAGVGIAMLLMVGSEVPFMALCDRLAARFGLQRTILAAMIISVCRFMLYGIGLPWWMLLILSFTQGAVNGIILVEFVRYIAMLAPKGMRSLAISAYYIIGSNISTIVCQLIGGIILDSTGASGVYIFFGLFNLIGVILYIIFGLHKLEKRP